ncbi:MAG: PKD domain-containing protein [Candidatus Thorarchaeota archaeon]
MNNKKLKARLVVLLLVLTALTSIMVYGSVFADDTVKGEIIGEADVYQGGNNVIDLDIGEHYSSLWQYKWDGINWGESCYREEYSLWYSNSLHESSGFTVIDTYGTSYNDADTHARLYSGNLYVDRDIYISTGNNRFFQISYIITNEGSSSYTDVRFFQQVDYDVPWTGHHYNDIGWYDSTTDFVWIKDASYFQNGFTGSKPSDDHGIWYFFDELYYDELDGDLNSVDYYDTSINYEGDPAIALQYNIGALNPGDSWDVTITFWFGIPISVVANAGPDQNTDEGSSVTFDGSASYTTGINTIVEYAWDFDGDFDYNDGFGVNPTFTFCDNDDYQVWLRVTDDYGLQAFDAMTVTVNNIAPLVDAGPDITVFSGELFCFSGSFTDPGCDTHTIEWFFGDGGSASGTLTPCYAYLPAGTYDVTLMVTDDDGDMGSDMLTVTVLRIPVLIDIKPGSFPNSINLKSKGVLPVAILNDGCFDPSLVDPASVQIGLRLANPLRWAYEDVDGDGDLDLILHFRTQELGLEPGDTLAVLIATLFDGRQIIGFDSIRIVPP